MSNANQPIVLNDIGVEFEIDGRRITAKARVVEQLFPRPRVIVEVYDVPREPQWSRESLPGDPSREIVSGSPVSEGPSKLTLEDGTEVEVVPLPWFFTQTDNTFYLAKSPSVFLHTNGLITQVQFGVLNFSQAVLDWPIVLSASPWLLTIEPVSNLPVLERTLWASSGYAVTHRGNVEREDGQVFSAEDAEFFLDCAEKFLSFVSSSSCAVTRVVGLSADNSEAWKRWGSRRVTPWGRHRSWADVTVRDALPDLFGLFFQNYSTGKAELDKALGWYVHSNETEALDVSIILNQAVLELLTYLTIGRRLGNTGEWMTNNLRGQGIDPAIPSSCRGLTGLAKQHSWKHGPHALVEIRNSMVHPNAILQSISIDAYHEAKQLGLWYTELLLLRKFDYNGVYAPRLVPVQRPGATELVPWASGTKK